MDEAKWELSGQVFLEAQLVTRLRRGEADSINALVRQLRVEQGQSREISGLLAFNKAFRPRLFSYIRRLLKNEEELAKEAWNDTLYRVHTRIAKYDSSRYKFITWAFIQARHSALTLLRPHLRQIATTPEELGKEDVADVMVDSDDRALKSEAVKRAMRRLTETERKLLNLRFVEGYGNVEIARGHLAGAIPEEHVRVYVSRAAKRLKNFFNEEITNLRRK